MSGPTRIVPYARALVVVLMLATSACAGQKPEVIVVGTLHQLHQDATYYSFSDLRRIILALKPDVLCVELQPQDLTARPEEKNKREYPEVIYPLIDAGHYRVYAMEPSEPMFSEVVRSIGRANQAFRNQQQEAAKRLDAFIDATYALLASYWKSPATVNDAFTDEVFAAKHAAQGRLIGKGEADGWTAWNEHFLSVIRRAAAENPGKRILVLVGAEHGFWLRERLRSDRRLHLADSASLLESLAPASIVQRGESRRSLANRRRSDARAATPRSADAREAAVIRPRRSTDALRDCASSSPPRMRALPPRVASLLACVLAPLTAAADETRHDAVIDGVRLTYWTSRPIRADDVPVLYLHGGPGYDSYSFRKTAGMALDKRWPVVYLDERGSGASERPWDKAYTIELMVRDIEGLRRVLGVKSMVVMGHSFGGILAAEYAVQYPQRVAKLVLLDAAVDLPAAMDEWVHMLEEVHPTEVAAAIAGPAGTMLRAAKPDDRCALSKARFALIDHVLQVTGDTGTFHDRQQFVDMNAKAEQQRLDDQSGYTNTGELSGELFKPASNFLCYRVSKPSALTMPVLVMVGAHDRAVGVAPQRDLTSKLSHAQLVVFPNSAHFPYQEEPAAFQSTLDAFLSARSE